VLMDTDWVIDGNFWYMVSIIVKRGRGASR
jgi:hypothetical protein